ncbi:MAG: heparin lyase I family protein, partial [Myxococcota bacterium]
RFPRRTGTRVLTLGNAGGRLKASTGYALVRIHDFDSESPPILLGFGELDGVTKIGVNYGVATGREQEVIVDYPLGVWHRWTLHLRWSLGDDGFGEFSLDGEPVASFTGPNLHNAAGNYLKLGLYRDPAIRTDNVVLIDDLAVGSSEGDVVALAR